MLPKVTNYGASIFKTIAKESHMDNSIKVTLFNSLKVARIPVFRFLTAHNFLRKEKNGKPGPL